MDRNGRWPFIDQSAGPFRWVAVVDGESVRMELILLYIGKTIGAVAGTLIMLVSWDSNMVETQVLGVSLILTSLSKDYDQFVMNYNMHSMRKTIAELQVMLKLAEQGLPKKEKAPAVLAINEGKIQKPQGKSKGHGKGKGKKVHHPKPKIPHLLKGAPCKGRHLSSLWCGGPLEEELSCLPDRVDEEQSWSD